MAPNRPRRVHRLPQRLDWTLIPAPLDLSLPDLTEKSPLPAIIVTPSSPSCEKDFSIAFLAPPPKPTLTERIKTTITSPVRTKFPSSTSSNPFKMTARLMIILALMMFVMAAHVITHRLATQRPHLDFRVMTEGEESPMSSWFGFRELWAGASDGDGGDGYDAAFEESSKHDVVGIPVEGGAWISSDAVVVKHRKHGGHGHSSQERDVDFVVVEDPPNSPAPAPVPAPQ